MVELRDVGHRFSQRGAWALDDISLAVESGVTGVLGVNGAGKTTLLRIVIGSLKPAVGERVVRDAQESIGYCPQHAAFPPRTRVVDVLRYLCWLRRIPAQEVDQHIAQALSWADLEDRHSARVGELSGGMQRRLAIAQAFIGASRLVVLDEPTTGLDPQQRVRCRELIEVLSEKSEALILSSHIIEDIWATAQRVIVVHQGRLASEIRLRESMGGSPVMDAAELERLFLSTITKAH